MWRLGPEALVEQAKERLSVRLDLLALIRDLGLEAAKRGLETANLALEAAKRADHRLGDLDVPLGEPVQKLPQRQGIRRAPAPMPARLPPGLTLIPRKRRRSTTTARGEAE